MAVPGPEMDFQCSLARARWPTRKSRPPRVARYMGMCEMPTSPPRAVVRVAKGWAAMKAAWAARSFSENGAGMYMERYRGSPPGRRSGLVFFELVLELGGLAMAGAHFDELAGEGL